MCCSVFYLLSIGVVCRVLVFISAVHVFQWYHLVIMTKID